LQNLFCTRYTPHLYAFEGDCKEPNAEHELELEKPQLSDLIAECKEILDCLGKILENMTVKINTDSKPPVLVEPDVLEESKPEVKEPEPKVEEPLIETHVDLPAESIIELLSFWLAIMFYLSLRLPDVYDPFQIFLQKTCSQEIGALICWLVFSSAELPYYVACILFELPSTTTSLSRKPAPTPPLWFSHDASVLIFRPPLWPV